MTQWKPIADFPKKEGVKYIFDYCGSVFSGEYNKFNNCFETELPWDIEPSFRYIDLEHVNYYAELKFNDVKD